MMHGLECGFCTPRHDLRAQRLLQETRCRPEEEIRWHIGQSAAAPTTEHRQAIQYAAEKINGVEFKEAAE